VSESISATHQYLLMHYDPMLTLKHLAEVMHSVPNGLCMMIFQKREPFTVDLAKAQRWLGRPVYVAARCVVEIINQIWRAILIQKWVMAHRK